MNSLLDVRQGAQRPTHLHLPRGKVRSSGPDVAEFAESAGLFLDDWQRYVLEEALAERADDKWAAFEVALIVARQNGKGSILEALELYHLFVLKTRLISHSAHEYKTAREHFIRIQFLIENTPELFDQVKPGSGGHVHSGGGSHEIRTAQGARLRFLARSSGSGRGFSGDLIVLDEAYQLPEQAIGAMGPTLSAMPNPQVWYTSSAPHADSHVLHGIRNRGLRHEGDRLALFDWSNPPDVDIESEAAIAAVNPGYPHRLTPDNLTAERDMMRGLGDEYLRERLGVPSTEDSTAGVFPPGTWAGCHDPKSTIPTPLAIALDVAPAMTFAAFAIAGKRADGLDHVELAKHQTGTGWILERARHYVDTYHLPIALDPKGPVAGLIDDLKAAEIPLLEITDMPKACATLQEKVVGGTIRHIGQAPLDAAAANAAIRVAGDSWRWGRAASSVDISPLVAVTSALAAATSTTPQVELIVL